MNDLGWICPKCGRANAPWVQECPCTEERFIEPYCPHRMPWRGRIRNKPWNPVIGKIIWS